MTPVTGDATPIAVPGHVHPGAAHPPAVAGPPRPLAGRRGVALPVVGGVVPAADPGAAHAGRRGPPRPAHPGHDAGARRAARRPVLPRRHAPLAGQLAAARAEAATRIARSPRPACAHFGIREYAEAEQRARRLRPRCGGTAPARCCASWSTPAPSNCSAARWRTRSSRCWTPRLREFALREGLADAAAAARPTPRPASGRPSAPTPPAWSTATPPPASAHFMVDGPSLHGDTALGRPVGDTDVVAFGRDLQVSYRVWSPKSGYPGHAAYRDFHTYDHATGLKPARVTGRNVAVRRQGALRPAARRRRGRRPRRRLRRGGARGGCIAESERIGRPAHVVAAFDTELFGHWWYEGPHLAGARAARAARGRGAGRHAARRRRARLRRRAGRIAAQLVGFRQGLAGVGGRAGGRPGAAEHRGRRHRADDRGQGAGRRRRRRADRATSSPTRSCARRC